MFAVFAVKKAVLNLFKWPYGEQNHKKNIHIKYCGQSLVLIHLMFIFKFQGNLGPPPLPPNRPNSLLHALKHPPPFLPPKKGILKGHRYDVTRSVSSDLDDVTVVLQNTVDNEYTNVYRRSAISPPGGATASISSSTDSPDTAGTNKQYSFQPF